MNRRSFIQGAALLGAASVVRGSSANDSTCALGQEWSYDGRVVRIGCAKLQEKSRIWVIGDTHFALHDERDDAYQGNYKRMATYGAPKAAFEKMLALARTQKPDLLLLVGDIISFPTLANVDYVLGQLKACGIPWLYIAGNHDWHFEGVAGSDIAQRAEWTQKRLSPLYQGENPLMASRVVKGVRWVVIDNSVYHILPEQLAFWRAEAAKGEPIALAMHIPFWHPGWSVTSCACPKWGAATDPYWEIERRERWAPTLTPETFEFRKAVFSTPNLVGVFTGHHHVLQFSQENGHPCFGTPSNNDGRFLRVSIG